MIDKTSEIESLITKAAAADKSEDALRFSQAACNAANAIITMTNVAEKAAALGAAGKK